VWGLLENFSVQKIIKEAHFAISYQFFYIISVIVLFAALLPQF